MKSKKKIITSTIITIILLILSRGEILPIILFAVFIVGAVVGFIIIFISKRNFGGITGDVMGATNEIVRLCSMIIIQAK